jgi:lipopolysaccharide transport system ATP-binding protein
LTAVTAIAIKAEGLGKRYRIGTAAERHDSLRSAIMHGLAAPARNFARLRRMARGGGNGGADELWALRDVSFDVRQAEVLGIIGRNGAGKSTLLKVLSRITDPTTGRARIRGRVGSLLEVGTGFHPELTGRENVFLNGSILGMDRSTIERRFDEIVEFSGVERFIDTPVKRYSSGMYLRLAFAVAAHLEPEVLIIDEVLAVGDAEFQKKCLGKMSEVAGHGRTVLFVSHNLGAVNKLCSRALLLREGHLVRDGAPREVTREYLTFGLEGDAQLAWTGDEAPGDHRSRLRSVVVRQSDASPATHVDMRRPFAIEVTYDAYEPFRELNIHVLLHDEMGDTVFHSTHMLGGEQLLAAPPGRHCSICRFPGHALNAGQYWISVYGDVPGNYWTWRVDRALSFEVDMTVPEMSRYLPGTYRGSIAPTLVAWERSQVAVAAELPPNTPRRNCM